MSNKGVSINDFAQILEDMAVTLSYKVVTKTTDPMTGSETSTFAAATNVTAAFFLNENKYLWDPEGLVEVGDAYIMVPLTVGIKRYDQFVYQGVTYYIESVLRRIVTAVQMVDYATCFIVST